jgi:hypothetical protein
MDTFSSRIPGDGSKGLLVGAGHERRHFEVGEQVAGGIHLVGPLAGVAVAPVHHPLDGPLVELRQLLLRLR